MFIKGCLRFLFITAVCAGLGIVGFNLFLMKDRFFIETLETDKTQGVKPNHGSLVYQLIDAEQQLAGTRTMKEQGEIARAKYDVFMHKARQIPTPNPKRYDVEQYFEALSALIDQYFYYATNKRLIESFVAQGIDCDLRSFIFYDLAKKRGVDVSIVYSPYHAFVVWNAPKGIANPERDLYWETTIVGGREAFPSIQKSFYLPSEDPHDYQPKNGEYAVDAYRLFSLFEFAAKAPKGKQAAMFKEYKNYRGPVLGSHLYELGLMEVEYIQSGETVSKALFDKVQARFGNSKTLKAYADAVAFEYYYAQKRYDKARFYYVQLPSQFKDYETRLKYATVQDSLWKRLDTHWAHGFSALLHESLTEEDINKYSIHHTLTWVLLALSVLLFLLSLWIKPLRTR